MSRMKRAGELIDLFPVVEPAADLGPVIVGEDLLLRKVAVDVALLYKPAAYEAWVREGERLARQS